MKKITKLSLLVLFLAVCGIMVALVRETSDGPNFRASEYDSYEECIRNIPSTWLEGSVEQMGAETACRHLHMPRPSTR